MSWEKMAILFLSSFFFLCPPAGAAESSAALKEQVRALLKEDPDLILDILREKKIEVFEIVEKGVEAKRELGAKKQLEEEMKNPFRPVIQPGRPILGVANAPITIVEYSDFQCSYCARAAGTIKELLKRYPGKIRVIFKHQPLQEFSIREALYFEALALQDPVLAWKFHDLAFASQQKVAGEREKALQEIVSALGAEKDRLARDLLSKEIAEQIDRDMQEARKFGLAGTPMFLINGVSVRGAMPIEEFEKIMGLVEERDRDKNG